MNELSAFSNDLLSSAKADRAPVSACARAIETLEAFAPIAAPAPYGSSSFFGRAFAGSFRNVATIGAVVASFAVAVVVIDHAARTSKTSAAQTGVAASRAIAEPPAPSPASPREPAGDRSNVDRTGAPQSRNAAPKTVPLSTRTCAETSLPETSPRCSETTNKPINVQLVNTCGVETIDLFYVAEGCREKFVRSVAAGETHNAFAFGGHELRIRDHKSGRLLKEVWVDPSLGSGPDPKDYEKPIGRLPDAIVTSESTATPSNRCSTAGYKADRLFRNDRKTPVDVFWVDYDCKERPPNRLGPGEHVDFVTFDTFLYRVRDSATGKLLLETAYWPGRNIDDEVVDNSMFVTVP